MKHLLITASMMIEAKRQRRERIRDIGLKHPYDRWLKETIKAALEAKALNDMIYEQQKQG